MRDSHSRNCVGRTEAGLLETASEYDSRGERSFFPFPDRETMYLCALGCYLRCAYTETRRGRCVVANLATGRVAVGMHTMYPNLQL
jgi:hypothetical protein